MKERWRAVPGFKGLYEVSDRGRVRSLDRWVLAKGSRWNDAPHWRKYKGQSLRPGEQKKSGHVSVAIGKDNSRLVHQLVLEAFKGPCPEGHEVLHKDHNPKNNRLTNLKYGTRSENVKMDYVAGKRVVWPGGRPNRWAK